MAAALIAPSESNHCRQTHSLTSLWESSRFNPTETCSKIGCTAQTLLDWVKKAEVDSGKRAGVPTDMAEKLKALERENRELRQANEILRKASAYFAQAELDRRVKP
jgi:transposase